MSEQKFTPLPWAQRSLMVDTVAEPYPRTLRGVCHCGGQGRSSDESEANAAYIVRACNAFPDLLAACKAALPELSCMGRQLEIRDDSAPARAIELVKAAIAKASPPASPGGGT